MPSRLRWVFVTFAVLIAALAIAPTAGATLVFVRNPLKPIVWAAADDGSGQRRVALGSNPHVSPDGQSIVYERRQKAHGYRSELMIAAADGSGSPRRLLANWSEPFAFDWSPDSGAIATVTGSLQSPEPPLILGRGQLRGERLVLIDVATGALRTIATGPGFFNGVSFAPEAEQLAYSKTERGRAPSVGGDIYSVSLVTGNSTRLTHDHRSLGPLWGPGGQIVFVKLLGAKRRRYGPKNELFLMGPGGEGVRRLTHTRVDPLLFGLTPTDWSADGTRLLAEFGGQDTSYAVRVNALTGAQRPVVRATERGLVGAALSADGSTILGSTGGFEPDRRNNVVSAPYAGGRPTLLARNAFEPDWSR